MLLSMWMEKLLSMELTDSSSAKSLIKYSRVSWMFVPVNGSKSNFGSTLQYKTEVFKINEIAKCLSLHYKASLNKAATPPPFSPVEHVVMKLKCTGAVSLRAVALQPSVNHVSVRNRKCKW